MDEIAQSMARIKATREAKSVASVVDPIAESMARIKAVRETATVTTKASVDPIAESMAKIKAAREAGTPITPSAPTTPVKVPTPSVTQHPLRWAGAQLTKPGNILANITEPLGKALVTGDTSGFKDIPKNVWDVATGKSTRGYMEMVQEAFPENKTLGTIAGLAVSIAADPLNVIGGGLTKVGRLAETVVKIKKAGQAIEEGSKLWKTIQASGKTISELEKIGAASKVKQAETGARAFLKAGNIPLLPSKASAAIYKVTGKAGDVIGMIPVGRRFVEGVSEPVRLKEVVTKIRGLFNTTSGNEAFDAFREKMVNLGDYRAAMVMDEAKAMDNIISKLPKEDVIQVDNFLEKGVIPTNPELHKIGLRQQQLYKDFAEIETKLGVAKEAQVSQYAPHIETKNEKTLLGKSVDFLSPRQWTTNMGYWEERTWQKFIGENGHEVVGQAEKLGFKPVPNIKGLTRAITWGEFRSMKEVEKVLSEHGMKLKFVPGRYIKTSSGLATGYFDPAAKEIVVAAGRDELDKVLYTLKHEITHSADFQLAGNVQMYEDYAKAGYRWKGMKDALEIGKAAVKKEWEGILEHKGINRSSFDNMPSMMQDYYKTPTELLARVGEGMLKDINEAKRLYPESVKAFQMMQRENPLFDLLNVMPPKAGEPITGQIFKSERGNYFQMAPASIEEVNKVAQREVFKTNPAVQFAYRGLANAKAVTGAEFFDGVKQFGIEKAEAGYEGAKGLVESKAPELKGLLFEPAIAKQIDAYHKALQPETIGLVIKTLDSVQNIWKSQALFSIGYHLRNAMGNVWNNFLAGVTNPERYAEAFKVQNGMALNFVDDIGRRWTSETIMDAAKKTGAVNAGQFVGDIERNVVGELGKANLNPFSQENVLFRVNRFAGGGIENNARLANFIQQIKNGLPIEDAAMEVKKFLFDYKDLAPFERDVLKRVLPFYTFTRKNLPLQIEQLIKQPGKFSGLERGVQALESMFMGDDSPANEKYLSDYIRSNTAMRINYNAKDKTYNYFLLGAWMPSYQAMDFLSQPKDNLIAMITPLIKAPAELMFNKSAFWKDTFGGYQEIERVPGEQTNFLGLNTSKRTAQFFRNIKVLNDLDKANPGLIFGGVKGQKSIFAKAGLPAVSIPGVGNVSPSQLKYTTAGNIPSALERTAGLFTGKLTSYKPTTARTYYNQETDKRTAEFKTLINNALKAGDSERAKLLFKQMYAMQKERGR